MEFKPIERCGVMIRARGYASETALADALADTLAGALFAPYGRPTAILLAGGTTPLSAYARLSDRARKPDPLMRVLFSDDRLVPPDSEKSNYRHVAPLLRAAGIPDHQLLRVRGELTLDAAVEDYHRQLDAFLSAGGEIQLGLLGLGADGHTASLFSAGDIAKSAGQYAVGVQRPDGLAGVSATPALFRLIPRLIVAVSGSGKRDIAATLLRAPDTLAAGQALQGHRGVELWTDRAAWPF